jgi:dipeptidyl aminopeptidase/acylaminoacyl peptidase
MKNLFEAGGKIAFMINGPTHCGEIYVLDLRQRKLTRLTQSMLGGIDQRDLTVPKAVPFKSFDGRRIPALLFKPKGASASKKCPIVLSIHGGPEAQERPMYIYFHQEPGYSVGGRP